MLWTRESKPGCYKTYFRQKSARDLLRWPKLVAMRVLTGSTTQTIAQILGTGLSWCFCLTSPQPYYSAERALGVSFRKNKTLIAQEVRFPRKPMGGRWPERDVPILSVHWRTSFQGTLGRLLQEELEGEVLLYLYDLFERGFWKRSHEVRRHVFTF